MKNLSSRNLLFCALWNLCGSGIYNVKRAPMKLSSTITPPNCKGNRLKFSLPQIFLVAVMLFFYTNARAQNYQEITFRIDSLASIGLPKSALIEVNKLDKLARKNNNTAQVIRAVIYHITFQSYLEENAVVGIIDTLKADIQRSSYPVKPILQSLLANMYWQYYQQNRYQFSQRSRLDKPDADFTKWDLRTVIDETSPQYQLSLQDASEEQNTRLEVLDGVLSGDKSTRYLRPTLYDLLVQRAFDFFLADEPALIKPKLPFSLNDPRFFSDSHTFANITIKTSDTSSTLYRGIKFLQQATLFHLKKNNQEALADLDLKRLAFLYNKSTIPGKNSLYLDALQNIATTFADKPISTDALVFIGKYYQQKDSLKTAHDYFQKAKDAYPQSIGGENAAELIKQIEQRDLSVITENVNSPGKPLVALIQYKNVKSVNWLLYKLSQQQLVQYNKLLNNPRNPNVSLVNPKLNDTVCKYLNRFKPLQDNTLQLPGTADYRRHSADFKIDALQNGNYVLLAKDIETNDSTILQLANFKVSRLSCIARKTPDNETEIRVMDRETGAPLKGVQIDVSGKIYRYNKNSRSTQIDTMERGITDAEGKFMVRHINDYNTNCSLIFKGDTLSNANNYINGQIYNDVEDEAERTLFFTDRQIYRPGQTIYFKGLQLSTINRKSKIAPNEKISVEFKDANNKDIKKQDFKTNEFGTFSGTFIIPQNILNGEMTIQTDNGEIQIRVEEYKRPTFNVEFTKLKDSYHLTDSVLVKGKVTAFSGYGLSQAKVAYHITRTRGYADFKVLQAIYGSTYLYEPPAEIAADTILTDSQGNYAVRFKAIPGDDEAAKHGISYHYEINADVTDQSGETHSGTTSVNIGAKDLTIQANIPARFFAKDPAKISVSLQTLNAQKLKGKVNISVYALQGPGKIFKKRILSKPDQFLLSKSAYEQFFPDLAYSNEDEYAAWPQKQKIIDLNDTTNDQKETIIDVRQLREQNTGVYKVIVTGYSAKGETDSVINYVNVINQPTAPQSIADWVVPVINQVVPGESAEFIVGIGKETHVLMERYRNEKMVSSQWLTINNAQRDFKIPITEADDDNTAIQFMMVYHNRLYTSYQRIYISRPDKMLNLRMLSFRNLLQPGEKEQWKMQISGYKGEKQAAEMVANLYDASLDDITLPQKWDELLLNYNRQTSYFEWNTNNFVSYRSSLPLVYRYLNYRQVSRSYESLNLFGYYYYGGYNSGYHNYLNAVKLKQQRAELDKRLADGYKANAALIKNGYDISGQVFDDHGAAVPGVVVMIDGTQITTSTNSDGNFKIKVPVNGKLAFKFVGYEPVLVNTTQADRITVTLKSTNNSLNEVVVVGYGSQARQALTGAVAGIQIRGNGTIGFSADTVTFMRLNGRDFSGGDRAAAIQSLPADILKNLQVIDDYGDQASMAGIKSVDPGKILNFPSTIPRTNFNETAFFYPQLHTDSAGQILIDFTMPESLTKWRFRALAHTKDLKTGYIEKEIVTQKQLSISANMPRFLREGDTLTVSARLSNLTSSALKGIVSLQLFNAVTMQPISLLSNPAEAQQNFDITAATNKPVSFKLVIPAGLDALTYRVTAASGNYSDGEENTLPVLTNRMLVIESMPMMIRAGQTKAFTFDKLVNQQSNTLVNKSLTLEYTQNPAWYAVQALPYMMEFPYECAEQVFSRYYANSLATNLVNKMPVVKRVFDQWRAANSPELLSNLEKNQELKATLIEETPWLRDAANETEQKKRIALLFDLNKMSYELKVNLDKLKEKQLPGGGFPWFGGDRADAYITRYILAGMGQLHRLGAVDVKNETFKVIADKGMGYLDKVIIDEADQEKNKKVHDNRILNSTEIHAWYTESYYTGRTRSLEIQTLLANYLNLAQKQWNTQGIYEQGMIALTMLRNKKPEVAQMIIKSLLETAQQNDDMGMYWAKNQLGYFWYQAPVETQSLMIELFTEAGNQQKAVDEMKIWLLRNKQANDWKTTKATAQACYALLMKSDSLLSSSATSAIKLDGKLVTELKPDLKKDEGTGYFKTSWTDNQVQPTLGKVEVINNSQSISWGALYWQYTEKLDKITSSNTDIHLERKYFIEKQTNSGPVLTAVDAQHTPKTGDLLKVVVYLKSDRDFEYVQLKDMRPAGTEPVDVLSTYKYQDGLYYYQVTKDVATNFFISQLNKGNYVFEYRLRVVQPGNYSTGISTVQSMYAPEFNAHSEGTRLKISK